MSSRHFLAGKSWDFYEMTRTSLSYFLWEGFPWWSCGGILLYLLIFVFPYESRLLYASPVPAAEVMRLRLIQDVIISQLLATGLFMVLRRLWPHQVIRQPWPFIKDCLICPLLGVILLILVLYGWDIIFLGAGTVLEREAGVPEEETLPLFFTPAPST